MLQNNFDRQFTRQPKFWYLQVFWLFWCRFSFVLMQTDPHQQKLYFKWSRFLAVINNQSTTNSTCSDGSLFLHFDLQITYICSTAVNVIYTTIGDTFQTLQLIILWNRTMCHSHSLRSVLLTVEWQVGLLFFKVSSLNSSADRNV